MTRNNLVSFICFLAVSCPSLSTAAAATVTRVLDGDTVEVTQNNNTVRVRLIDIDAPEKSQPYGQRARQRLSALVKGASTVDVESKGKDGYGRVLGRLWLKVCSDRCTTKDAGSEMVENGFAWAYRYKGKASSISMLELEQAARKSRFGLWQDVNAVEPWKWRQSHKHKEKTIQ
ncbi:thermonuclease family protein [Escherichia coli]